VQYRANSLAQHNPRITWSCQLEVVAGIGTIPTAFEIRHLKHRNRMSRIGRSFSLSWPGRYPHRDICTASRISSAEPEISTSEFPEANSFGVRAGEWKKPGHGAGGVYRNKRVKSPGLSFPAGTTSIIRAPVLFKLHGGMEETIKMLRTRRRGRGSGLIQVLHVTNAACRIALRFFRACILQARVSEEGEYCPGPRFPSLQAPRESV
jgi:hypothetical protein